MHIIYTQGPTKKSSHEKKNWKICLQPLAADNTFFGYESQNLKNSTQTAITQQCLVWFTQTKHQNLPLSIHFTLLDSSKVQKFLEKTTTC